MTYPIVLDPLKVGGYPASAKPGGGYVWGLAPRSWNVTSRSSR